MTGQRSGEPMDAAPASPPAGSTGTLEQLVAAHAEGAAALDRTRRRLERESRLSTGYLGVGTVALGAAVLIRGLAGFAWAAPAEPWGWLSAAGWGLVVTVYTIVVCVAFGNQGALPAAAFRTAIGVGVTAMALDTVATLASRGSGPHYPTVEIGVGATVLACASFRPIRELVRVVLGIGIAAAAGLVAGWLIRPDSVDVGVSNFLLTVTPPAAIVAFVSVFDRHVRRELDRTVVESTIEVRGRGLGILAVSELARLDARAEELLDDVGSGRPGETSDASGPRAAIPPETAVAAAALGDDLRAALVTDLELTWLQVAVSDSVYLSPVVSVRDPEGLAAGLGAERRRALLSVVWLLAARNSSGRLRIDLAFIADPDDRSRSLRTAGILEITLAGITRRSIDSSIWPVIDLLGPRSMGSRPLRIVVALGHDDNGSAGQA